MHKPITSKRHHWWPRSLSSFWADPNGFVTQLAWNGNSICEPPGHFGAINNAHNIKIADAPTAWDESFESAFDNADGWFPDIIEWLLTLEATHKSSDATLEDRLESQMAPAETLDKLATCIISLIVRSPRFRNSVSSAVGYYRDQIGLAKVKPVDAVIGLNMRECQQRFARALAGRGKFAVLFTNSREFIFGDGFFQNFSSTTALPLFPRCLVPLTPKLCVLYAKPLSYRMDPRLVTVQLTPDEVTFVNRTMQIYSGSFLFYRAERPDLIADFSRHEFGQYSGDTWIDRLIDAVTNA
jgi:hypothetical protein